MPIPIPEVRLAMLDMATRLRQQAATLLANAKELERLSNGAHRRPPGKPVAPASSVKMTAELRKQIRQYAKDHPMMSVAAMGAHFGVNSGRVSEAIHNIPGRNAPGREKE